MWLLFTGLAVVSRASYGVLTKVLSNHAQVSAIAHSVLLLLAGGVLSLLVLPFSGFSFDSVPAQVWSIMLLTLGLSALGNITYFMAIAKLESGVAQIVFSSTLIWSLVLASVFLGTELSWLQYTGVAVLLFAILLAQYQKQKFKLQPGMFLMLLSAALFAGFQVANAQFAQQVNLGTYLTVIYFGSALLVALPYAFLIRNDVQKAGKNLAPLAKAALITAAASVLNYIFAYFAFRYAPDTGIVVLLFTSQVVLAVILSAIFLKERTNLALKLTAGALAVIAAVMIQYK